MQDKAAGFLRWPRFTMVVDARTRLGSAVSDFRWSVTGFLRFNAKGPEGLIGGKSTGKPPKLNISQRRALAEIVENGPITAIHGVVRWRLADLARWIFEDFRISLDCSTVSRELRALGFCKISARPRHKGQNEFAVEDFKKTSSPSWKKFAPASRPTPS